MEKSIIIRDTNIAVTDVLQLIAEGYSYYQILLRHPGLNLADIMISAKLAHELIAEFVTPDRTIRVDGDLNITCHSGRIVNLDEMRRQHPRAFEPWTKIEDEELAGQYHQGMNMVDIARLHGRKRGAIKTRLKKLGLISPQDNRSDRN